MLAIDGARSSERDLRAEGYVPGAPSAVVAAEDAGVCAHQACRRCGRPGLDYRPFVHPRERRRGVGGYRALAVCPECGHAEEF